MKVTEVVANSLVERGVQRVYGIPGTETLALIEALGKVGIQYVLTHHETTAGHIAAVEGHLLGIPGVCLVTQGPGATNMLTAVASAGLDHLPLLAIATTVSAEPGRRITHQRAPLLALFGTVTKLAAEVTAENAEWLLPKVLELACAPRPGPVFLTLPGGEARREVQPDAALARLPKTPGGIIDADSSALEAVAARLWGAKRPALVAGMGAVESKVSASLLLLAERMRCPVALSPRAKGQIPEDHPLFAGTYGAKPDRAIHDLLDTADLVLLVGLDGAEFSHPRPFTAPAVSLTYSGENDGVFSSEINVEGDLSSSLAHLASGVPGPSDWKPEELEACRQSTAQALTPKGAGGLAPQTVMRLLREELPRNAVAMPDVGAHKQMFCQAWTSYEPDTFFAGTGFAPMGIGLASAIAAKQVYNERPVVCLTGDGGLLMFAGELRTLARLGLGVLVVVLRDCAITGIKVKQEQKGYAPAGMDFGCPDLVSVGRGFGMEAAQVDTEETCRAAIRQALHVGGPFLLQANIDSGEYR